MTWIITRELNLFCNPEEIGDFFWANLFALESFKVIHCSVIYVLCCFQQLWYIIIIICACQQLLTWEFDPGSGWTLAACLTHASRTKHFDRFLRIEIYFFRLFHKLFYFSKHLCFVDKTEKINLKKLLTDKKNCGITNKSLEQSGNNKEHW